MAKCKEEYVHADHLLYVQLFHPMNDCIVLRKRILKSLESAWVQGFCHIDEAAGAFLSLIAAGAWRGGWDGAAGAVLFYCIAQEKCEEPAKKRAKKQKRLWHLSTVHGILVVSMKKRGDGTKVWINHAEQDLKLTTGG